MDKNIWFLTNAVLGSLTVNIGLWLLLGDLPIPGSLALIVGLAGLLAWQTPTIAHIWAVSTLLLGLESLAWPVLQMAEIQKLGPEPPLEDLQRIFTAVLFGLFSGVFWMTFSYGIYKRIRSQQKPPEPSKSAPSLGGKKKKKGKGNR
ncbi:MAG: hypothetical protein JSU59_12140 [Nitrospirota bacterium]|nr:MAG: hypothetical protein JSU59_12140 [Nitrospirota bacterium]